MAGGELVLASRLRSMSMLRSLNLCGTAFSAHAVPEIGCRSAAFLLSAPLPLKHHHLHQLACRNSSTLQQRLNYGELQGQNAGLGGAHCKWGSRLQAGQGSLCKQRHSKGLMSTLWAGQHQKTHEYLGSQGVSVQCNSTSAESNGGSGSQPNRGKRRVVFLGTPEVCTLISFMELLIFVLKALRKANAIGHGHGITCFKPTRLPRLLFRLRFIELKASFNKTRYRS
jgi:hypothetical protein